jgi:hypothetical protein
LGDELRLGMLLLAGGTSTSSRLIRVPSTQIPKVEVLLALCAFGRLKRACATQKAKVVEEVVQPPVGSFAATPVVAEDGAGGNVGAQKVVHAVRVQHFKMRELFAVDTEKGKGLEFCRAVLVALGVAVEMGTNQPLVGKAIQEHFERVGLVPQAALELGAQHAPKLQHHLTLPVVPQLRALATESALVDDAFRPACQR